MRMASPVPAEDDLAQAGIKLAEFDSDDESDGDYDEFDDDEEEELQREAEKHPKTQTGSKYMRGSIFKTKLDKLIKEGRLKAGDPVVKLLYDYGFNRLPDWDVSTAKKLREEVASALAACCDFKDVEIDELDACERGLAECVESHIEIHEMNGSIISSALDPVVKKLTPRQWARQMSKYITEPEWRGVFDPDLKELPDITKYLSDADLPTERGIYLAMLIAKDDNQHNHIYPGFSQHGVRKRQQDRWLIFNGKRAPETFFERLMCQKDPTTQAHLRDFPLWGNPLRIPDDEFETYTRAVFLTAMGLLAEGAFALRLSGYDGRIKKEGVKALHGLGLNCTSRPWWGTLQHCPLLDSVHIPWPEEMRKALRSAYKAQWDQDNQDKIQKKRKMKYDRESMTFPCEADPGCNKMFSSAPASRRHSAVCRGQLEYLCRLGCGASFDWLEKMERHVRENCKLSPSRTSIFCRRGCGAEFSSPLRARTHANSTSCINFDGNDLLGISCPRGCGGNTFETTLRAVRHANSEACPRYTIASTAVVQGNEAVLVPRIGQAGVLDLPEVHSDRALEQISSLLGFLGEDEDLFRRYVDSNGGGGMDELVRRYC